MYDPTSITPEYAARCKAYWSAYYKAQTDAYEEQERRLPAEMQKLYIARQAYNDALCAFGEACPGVKKEADKALATRKRTSRKT